MMAHPIYKLACKFKGHVPQCPIVGDATAAMLSLWPYRLAPREASYDVYSNGYYSIRRRFGRSASLSAGAHVVTNRLVPSLTFVSFQLIRFQIARCRGRDEADSAVAATGTIMCSVLQAGSNRHRIRVMIAFTQVVKLYATVNRAGAELQSRGRARRCSVVPGCGDRSREGCICD